jgi:nucleotide-binding universal stress UspA family protein
MSTVQQPVIVVVRGTVADRAAVRLAAAEALLGERPLHLLATYEPPDPHTGPIGWAPQLVTARTSMLRALSWVRETHPRLPFDYRVVPGDPADVLVRGAPPDTALGTLDPFSFDRAGATTDAERLLAEELAGWSEKYPDVAVHRQAVHGPDVANALARFASGAALLVVGVRSRPALSGQMLGAVSRRLIRQAPCPVAVVRTGP